jgi:hypothetical protein
MANSCDQLRTSSRRGLGRALFHLASLNRFSDTVITVQENFPGLILLLEPWDIADYVVELQKKCCQYNRK